MSCIPFCGRASNLTKFERKAKPVLEKFHLMKDDYTKMASENHRQYKISRDNALRHFKAGESVMAFAAALEAMRYERKCSRLMRFVKQIGDSISKIDSVWDSHSMVEGFATVSESLHLLSPSEEGDDKGEDSTRKTIDVSLNLHKGFDDLMTNLEREVSRISVVDETGVAMEDSEIADQIRRWQNPTEQREPSPPEEEEDLTRPAAVLLMEEGEVKK